MSRFRVILVSTFGAFLVFAASAGITGRLFLQKLDIAQHQIDALAQTAAEAAKRAAHDSMAAATALYTAEVAERERNAALAALTRRRAERDSLHRTADSVVATAPDTCEPVITALQREAQANADLAFHYQDLLSREIVQHSTTKLALLRAKLDLGEAQRALAGVAVDARRIEVPRPSLLSRILPQSSVGCTAGLSPLTARPDLVCGASLGWRVSL